MSQSFTASHEGVFGNLRYRFGTLTMTDGGRGSSVASGLEIVALCQLNPKTANSFSQYPPVIHSINSNVNGDIKAVSAGSGDTYHAFVVGW